MPMKKEKQSNRRPVGEYFTKGVLWAQEKLSSQKRFVIRIKWKILTFESAREYIWLEHSVFNLKKEKENEHRKML